MADFLTAIKSVREEKNADLLTAVGSKHLTNEIPRTPHDDSGLNERTLAPKSSVNGSYISNGTRVEPARAQKNDYAASSGPPETPTEALAILRSQPSLKSLSTALDQLHSDHFDASFNLAVPGPLQAQIINALLSEIVPNFWRVLDARQSDALLACCRNLAGLNAIVARLRLQASQRNDLESVSDVLDIAGKLLDGDGLVSSVAQAISRSVEDSRKREMVWKEFVNLIGSGKIVGAVAQAEDAVHETSKSLRKQSTWLASGNEYSAWLGRNIAKMISSVDEKSQVKEASLLLAKSLHLGHSGQLLEGLVYPIPSSGEDSLGGQGVRWLFNPLPLHAKRTFIEHLLRWLSTSVAPDTADPKASVAQDVSAVSGLLSGILKDDILQLQSQLSDHTLCASLSRSVRRGCLAVLHADAEEDTLQQLLEKLIATFSSTLFIAHAPIAQQESLAQTLLLTAGYVHRSSPMSLLMTTRSSGYMQGVSNRLDSSNARARLLGMIVGTALSKLVDKPGSQMDFGTDELKSEDAQWHASLPRIEDTVGTFESFQALMKSEEQVETVVKTPVTSMPTRQKKNTINGKAVFGPPRPPRPMQTKIVGERVTEILDDEPDVEDDLKPYAKPDSDPEDSDEDATLVNRNKSRAPVYIRDLMAGLRDDKNYDKFNLAIKTAAQLIRRKACFGKEVKDHAEELAGMLCNLQDPFDTDDFDDMRLQALVAVLLCDVPVIAPYLSRQAFADGYSIAQRCIILSALGLGGREMAGFKLEDEEYNPKQGNTDFASKKLPPKFDAIYGASSSTTKKPDRLEAASASLENTIIQPLALSAADQHTAALNPLKVRNFSSRLNPANRTTRKPLPNALAKNFPQQFFFPLVNRYQQDIAAYGQSSIYAASPYVLVTFVKTLALLLHASGPATLNLPVMSEEMWDLLLSLRVAAVGDISVLQAVLFALLTLLETNTDQQRIAQEHPKQLMETQRWVEMVFERMSGGGGGAGVLVDAVGEEKSEEAKVRTLAAGVLMKVGEIVEGYQRLLVGHA